MKTVRLLLVLAVAALPVFGAIHHSRVAHAAVTDGPPGTGIPCPPCE